MKYSNESKRHVQLSFNSLKTNLDPLNFLDLHKSVKRSSRDIPDLYFQIPLFFCISSFPVITNNETPLYQSFLQELFLSVRTRWYNLYKPVDLFVATKRAY